MTADEDALLEGIAADPTNDVPRLVYADWLQEHDRDEYAEFIRIQCEIAKLEIGPRAIIDVNVHLWRRQQELLNEHFEKLLPESMPVTLLPVQMPIFRRGFIDELTYSMSHFVDHHDVLASLRPRPSEQSLLIYNRSLELLDVVSEAAINRITFLQYSSSDEDNTFIDHLINRSWPSVKWLSLSGFYSYANHLGFSRRLSMTFPNLNKLEWQSCQLTDDIVIELLNSGLLHRLEVINLRHNNIEDQAALELSDRLARSKVLRHLNLSNNPITRVGQSALLAAFGSRVDLF